MRLCFIADSRSIHTRRWISHFAGKGHEVHLISYEPLDKPIYGVTVHVLPSLLGNLYLSFWPRHIRIILLLERIKPDLVHAHFIAKYGYHLLFLGKRYYRIVSAWGDDVLILPKQSRLIFLYTRWVLESVNLIYAVSEDIRNHIISDFGIPATKTRYLPFGVDPETFRPREDQPKNGDHTTITIFSNRGFLPVYGMDTLLKGFAIARERNHNLHLILKGEGPDKERLMRKAEEEGLSAAVTFLDRTRHSDVPEDLRNADIYVSVATSDGSPVSLLEAMATGLSCIASSVGGIPEWIEDGKNGLLVPPSDPRLLAEAILSIAGDPVRQRVLGENARKTIIERGNWDALMRIAEDDYQAAVAGRDR